MADAIKAATCIESELIGGSGGVFDVVIDGERVYSKRETGQFPSDEEILAHLKTG